MVAKYMERARPQIDLDAMFAKGRIHLETNTVHTVHPLLVDIPRGRLTVVSGVSGSGKTTMVLETLVPALRSAADGTVSPSSIRLIDADGISKVELIDATPIGANIRSTVATYCGVHDDLRRAFAKTSEPIRRISNLAHSHTTRASCAAPLAMEPVPFRWTCSSCPMLTSRVPIAMGHGMHRPPMTFDWFARTASPVHCRN